MKNNKLFFLSGLINGKKAMKIVPQRSKQKTTKNTQQLGEKRHFYYFYFGVSHHFALVRFVFQLQLITFLGVQLMRIL